MTPPHAPPSGSDSARESSLAHPREVWDALTAALGLLNGDRPPFPDRRDDARYCDECREITNHDGESHGRAEAETPEEY